MACSLAVLMVFAKASLRVELTVSLLVALMASLRVELPVSLLVALMASLWVGLTAFSLGGLLVSMSFYQIKTLSRLLDHDQNISKVQIH